MITVELQKLIRRPRTWLAVFLLVALPTVVAVFLAVTHVAPRPGQGPPFLAEVLSNGSLYPAAALAIVLPIFLPVAVAVVAGDAVSGEASGGTLRYLLVRPVGRTRLLVAKLVSVSAFVVLSVIAVAGVAYIVGTRLFGTHPLPSLSAGPGFSGPDAAWRILLTIAYVGASMMGVAAIALFLSTVTDSALAAALGALAALITSQVLVELDASAAIKPYLPTRYWLSFVDLFRTPVLWRNVERGFALQAIYVAILLGMAWANFATKDVKS
jgi:ABC-2 type transport system permease protein